MKTFEAIKPGQYPNIERFNHLWNERQINIPLLIMVGGYAGVGKSTLACAVSEQVSNIGFFATGFARAAAQTFITPKDNPALYKSTFKLHELTEGKFNEREIIELFKQQRDPITKILTRSADFIAGEHQHTIIDGNHVSPDLSDALKVNNPGVILFETYLVVSDLGKHREMMVGPTHSRTISDIDFRTARILHDFIVSEAKERGKPVFEYTEGIKGILGIVNSELEKVLGSL